MAALVLWGAAALGAQQPTPRPAAPSRPAPQDSAATPTRDSTARGAAARDTTKVDSATARRKRLVADTVKAPLAHAELPLSSDGRWHWTGEALRAAGATTLADLLARIPGATAFRANWIPAPQYIAWNGDAGRVRVFLDGIEQDAIDPRNGQVLDLAMFPIWQVEEVSVEPAPGELRVHLRTWRVEKTIPYTQTDIVTGSEQTNLYRGYFGKRLHNGGALQLAAQQFNTVSFRTGGDGSSLQFFARFGWAWKKLSVDVATNRASQDRAATIRYPLSAALINANGSPAFKGSIGAAYARVAWGDPDAQGAPWIQFVAATQSVAENSKVSASAALTSTTAVKDTVDSTASRTQYVLAAGASRWGLNASATARLRVHDTRSDLSPSVRLGYDWKFVSFSAYAETRGADSTRRMDVATRVAPFRWLVFSGAYGSYAPKNELTGGPSFTAARAEVATTLFGITLTGGAMTRGLTTLAAPIALDSSLVRVGTSEVKGMVGGVRGPIWGDLGVDLSVVRWEASGPYRPQMEVHSSLILDSRWPGRFPRNNFHVLASTTYDHRTPMFFPTATGNVGQTAGTVDVIGARLEIRIESGTVFYQTENMVGKVYETAPGYMMPRRLQYYGLRWTFWN
jgi:hypothetical protein